MRFMVMVKATPNSEKEGAPPDPQAIADMNDYIDEQIAAGVLLGYDGLHPSAKGARVKFNGKSVTGVVDGPFTESKELIAGFSILEVPSLAEAVGWVKRMPSCGPGEYEVEIRQIFEPEDFAGGFGEEDIQKERDIRRQLAEKAARR